MSCSRGGRGRSAQSPRPSVVPPLSNRTLQHPSFLPLYIGAGFVHSQMGGNNQTVQHIIPIEVFYNDPTMNQGRRIPNVLSDLGVLECFQLNTLPPVMTAQLAPPNRPDPFRSGPHPTRNLGCPTWTTTSTHPQVQPSQAVVQLTQEEDQAVTNLLKLHHEEPRRGDDDTLAAAAAAARDSTGQNPCIFNTLKSTLSSSAEEVHGDVTYPRKAGSGSLLQRGRGWSHVELEAADTLLSGFRTWDQCCQKSEEILPDPPPDQRNQDLPISTENQQEPEAEPSLNASLSDTDRLPCVSENGGQVHRDSRSTEDEGSACGDFPEVRERALSDLEGDAVHVLLSLGDVGPLEILQ